MIKNKKILPLIILFFFILCTSRNTFASDLSEAKISELDKYVETQMKKGEIPALSIVITNGDKTVYKKAFGYADVKEKRLANSETLFELGSTSKAFTALAILKLEKEGRISLSDPIKKYIPWLTLKYNGKEVNVTIEQFLHHSSGIPYKSIDKIPESESETALEECVKTLVGQELQSLPGKKFSYATINYDVLGLVVKNVSGQSFEEYMKKNILQPMGLENTYLFREDASAKDMSTGYKIGFLKPKEYAAPMYRGNTPAGYFIINGDDMAKWLKIQLGVNLESKFDKDLIIKSHEADLTVNPGGGGESYASGWFVNQSLQEIFHSGSNPNFSSSIILKPNKNIGVAVLANRNSPFTDEITMGILNIIEGKEATAISSDMYKDADKIAVAVLFGITLLSIVLIGLSILAFKQLRVGQRKFAPQGTKQKIIWSLSAIFIFMLGYCLYKAPEIFLGGVSWGFVRVWGPETIVISAVGISITILLLYFYLLFTSVFPKTQGTSYFSIAILSIISGLGNALIIFMINTALNKGSIFNWSLFLYFILGILLYVFGQKIVSTKLIVITNDMVYKLRMELLNKLLKTSYEDVEKIESGKLQAAMNNDTETISNFANILISGATSIVTLICCFVYLGIISIYGLLLSLLIILAISSIYFLAGRSANKLWENTRDIQNVFFKFINDMESGFKELSLNGDKCEEFKSDMEETCNTYRDKKSNASLKFVNVFVIGELLFTVAIGGVAFLFPIVFSNIQSNSLRSYIFVLLYMTGPVHGILNAIPNLIQVKISLNRVNQLIKEMSQLEKNQIFSEKNNIKESKFSTLKLSEVEYKYTEKNGENFKIGPITYQFNSGEIVFITGGNGSGKSTLAKLITGLYEPSEGFIKINEKETTSKELGSYYSTIFSDFHLFDKLYGIDYTNKAKDIQKYLKMLQIEDKLEIENGVFSTIKLSTGQKKRLALMISYIEDKEIYLFDEWAADQDPEFRKLFYTELLPDLKKKGKCIIAITHDDRYFHLADKVIKIELGKIINEKVNSNYDNIAFPFK
ncbi:hypothetical protein CSC2_28760 [Clostridium zeae]|uniref:Cyclic peptide export ABC transporter n=1 Tax=Clostridium zeae TaxID=2759022 RepID=A0ABQ1EC38_9CLOT|nr:cyclic peptide export ABC transporter [Clostridium zeae]GFZ32350.1 hypothetical protein CSC2_28760 [Clostridium zeae]